MTHPDGDGGTGPGRSGMSDVATGALTTDQADERIAVSCVACGHELRISPQKHKAGFVWRCGPCTKKTGPFIYGGHISLYWRHGGESALRSSLAQLARLHGWCVEEEVSIPGWGRIDLVISEPSSEKTTLVELKLDLTKPANVRRAFQQADGYGRWWATNRGTGASTFLVSDKYDEHLVTNVGDMYLSVLHLPLSHFEIYLTRYDACGDRLLAAQAQRDELRAQLALQEIAITNLTPPEATNGASS